MTLCFGLSILTKTLVLQKSTQATRPFWIAQYLFSIGPSKKGSSQSEPEGIEPPIRCTAVQGGGHHERSVHRPGYEEGSDAIQG